MHGDEMDGLLQLMHELSEAESSLFESVDAVLVCCDVLTGIRDAVELRHVRRLSCVEAEVDEIGAAKIMRAVAELVRDMSRATEGERDVRECLAMVKNAATKIVAISAKFDGAALGAIRSYKKAAASACDELEDMKARHQAHAISNKEVRRKVWSLTSGHCIYCNVPLALDIREHEDLQRQFHIDHIVPKAHGGPDHISNYVPACRACNSEKRDLPVAEFITLRHMKQGKLVLMKVLPQTGQPTDEEFKFAVEQLQKYGPTIIADEEPSAPIHANADGGSGKRNCDAVVTNKTPERA